MGHRIPSIPALRRLALAAGAAAVLLAGTAPASALEAVSVRLKWVAQTQFAGFYVADAKGFYEQEGLDVTINPGGPNLNAESLVASGSDQFALGGGIESLLAGRNKGLPIVGLAMMHQSTPYGYVAKADSGIKTLADFKGKTVSSFFSGSQHTLNAMLKRQGVDPAEVNIIAQSVSMTPFINGEVDVANVTLYNELNVLKARGVDDLTMFLPDEVGITVPRDVLITSEQMIADKPEVVQAFLDATLRGWKYAIENQAEAVDIVMTAAPGLEKDHQVAMLAEAGKLMVAGEGGTSGLGFLDEPKLKNAHDLLLESGVIESPVDFSKALDASFWSKVPDADKKMPGNEM